MRRRLSRRLCASVFMTAALLAGGATRGQAAQSGAIAQNAASHAVYLAMPSANAVFVLSNKSMRLLTVLKVPASPSALAVDPGRQRLYVASDQDGMVSVFSTATYELLRIYPVGGHPTGLALMNRGRTLLISDGQSGAVAQLPALTARAQSATVFSAGPGTAPLLAPRSGWRGAHILAWARGFAPGEAVDVLWGVQPLTQARANAAGFVLTSFQVPANAVLTNNLVDFRGERGTTTQSAFMMVGPAPKLPKRILKKTVVRRPSLLQRLFAPSITLPIANPLARHPAHAPKAAARLAQHGAAAGTSIPILSLAAIPLFLLMVRVVLKRRGGKKGQQADAGKGKRKGRRGAAAKRAA